MTRDDWNTIEAMVKCVRDHPSYKDLPAFDAEIMAITACPETGLLLKCKSDLFGSSIIDFKSTSVGIKPSDLVNDMVKWNYHLSAAFYQDIIFHLIGERLPFKVVPVTKKAPVECEFYVLSDEILEEGRKLYKAGLKRILRWRQMHEPDRLVCDKKERTLYPTARMLYNTKDTLEFIEGHVLA